MRGKFHAAGLPAIALATAGWSAVMLAAALWGCSGKPIVFPEEPKIEHLLEFIAGMKGVEFIIDGQVRDASFAADYFRRGLEEKRAESRTAKDFIQAVCSFSPTNGSPFLVQFADGSQSLLGEHLSVELARYERELRGSP